MVDWACGNCDQQADPDYLGCYANQDHCPKCWTHKRLCQHMTMATRTERIKAGTLKPKVQAKADREARKNASNPAGKVSSEVSDDKFQAQLLKDYLAGKFASKEDLEKAANNGQNSGQGVGVIAKSGDGDGDAAGETAASTAPADLVNNSEWTVKGPTLREINNKLHHNK